MIKNPRNHSESPTFITDHNLGKLAKWLRLIGYDTVCQEGKTKKSLWERALRENRIVLTRKKNLRYYPEKITTIVIEDNRVELQLALLRAKLDLNPSDDQSFKICSVCNSRLAEVEKKLLTDRVPPYVLEIHDRFYECPICLRVYWPGSHVERIKEIIRQHSLKDHP
ncbi:MAG: Mut7-C RNAse domain-containing protein [Syntrophaceae bacterium]|nr:Mut7-C RNAse domain-containing protein [Syntrophaceae bacterium]